MVYAASVRHDSLDSLIELLGDCVFQPAFPETEFEQAKENIEFELQQLETRPDPEPLMTELIHEVCFISMLARLKMNMNYFLGGIQEQHCWITSFPKR